MITVRNGKKLNFPPFNETKGLGASFNEPYPKTHTLDGGRMWKREKEEH